MTDSSKTPGDQARPAGSKSLTNGWIFPIGGGLIGAYFLINGALSVRESQGDLVFALLMAGIVLILAVLGTVMFRTYRSDRESRS